MTEEEKKLQIEEENTDQNPKLEENTKDSAEKSEEITADNTVTPDVKEETSPKEEIVAEEKNDEVSVENTDTKSETTPAKTDDNENDSKDLEKENLGVNIITEEIEDDELVKKDEEPGDVSEAESQDTEVVEIDRETLIKSVKDSDDEFDWDNVSKVADSYTSAERAKLEALYDKTLSTISESEVVEGTVVFVTKREVVINIGYKSEAVISLNEFRYNPELKEGDKVEVYVETQEDKHGQLILSHKKARALRSWDRVNEAFEKNEIIKGYIKCRTKGGMIVDVFGIEAFLPGSQIDVKPIRDYDIYVSKTMEFKIVKINHEFKNVVVSHKALIEAELEIQRQEIILKLEKGQVLEGTVKNITSYGVFIDLGGVDGLIHITDLSWGRVTHPEEIVELDQKINVVILDFDDAKKRIALGLKQLTKHPWDSLDAELKVGDKVKGKVVVLADYGAFIEIAPGVEGLIHVSEMSWSQHLRSAQEFLKVGDEIEAQILTLDREERKMSLGMKQLREDPWIKIDDKYSVGSKHEAEVRNFTGFGVFVEIEEGIDGLIHISDLSWTKKIKHPAEFTAVGEKIEVVVLEIDKENRRLSLGHKQLEENPWDVFETIFGVDSIHEGTIVSVFDKGSVIALPYGVEGFATPRHMVKEDGTTPKVDEKLEFKVIEFSKASKRIILSHSRIFEDLKKATETKTKHKDTKKTKRAVKDVKSKLESTTLGDITDLAALKTKMEQSEKEPKQVDKPKKEIKKPEAVVDKKIVDKKDKAEITVAEEKAEKTEIKKSPKPETVSKEKKEKKEVKPKASADKKKETKAEAEPKKAEPKKASKAKPKAAAKSEEAKEKPAEKEVKKTKTTASKTKKETKKSEE